LAKKYYVPLEIFSTSASKKMYIPGTVIVSGLPMDASLATIEDSEALSSIQTPNPYR